MKPYTDRAESFTRVRMVLWFGRIVFLLVGGYFLFFQFWDLAFLIGLMPDLEQPTDPDWETYRSTAIATKVGLFIGYFVALSILKASREHYELRKPDQLGLEILHHFKIQFPDHTDQRDSYVHLNKSQNFWGSPLHLCPLLDFLDEKFKPKKA